MQNTDLVNLSVPMCESAVSVDTKMCTSSIQQQEATLTPQHIPMVNTYNMTKAVTQQVRMTKVFVFSNE